LLVNEEDDFKIDRGDMWMNTVPGMY